VTDRHKLIDFPVGYRSCCKVSDEQIVAAYQADVERRRKAEHEEVMRKDREAKECRAAAPHRERGKWSVS
jgi:hypothetical protein